MGWVTKVFTTTLLVQLRDQGWVSLDTPMDQYFLELVQTL